MSFSQNLVVARPRPSVVWFIIWIGLLAFMIWLALPLVRPDATVAVDGKVHAVDVARFGDSILWVRAGAIVPTCVVKDRVTGRGIGLQTPGADFSRTGSRNRDWLAAYRLDPGRGHLTVRCTGYGPATNIQIGPAPRFRSLTVGSPRGLIGMAGISIIAALGLISTAIRGAGRPGARKR
jgi:hypothetical protein